jgi:hypothetical protein
LARLINLAAAIAVGAGSMLPLLRLFGVQEADDAFDLIRRRLPGKRT